MAVEITGVYVIDSPSNKMVGTAKCTIHNDVSFLVKIFEGKTGLFAGLPSIWNKTKNDGAGGYDQAIFLSDEVRDELNIKVREAFEGKVAARKAAPSRAAPIANPVPHADRTDNDFDDDDIPF